MRRIEATKRLTMLLALLLLIFVIFVLQGCTFRQALFERSTKEWAQKPVVLVDAAACQECHQTNYREWARSAHATVSCESCHGLARSHLEGGSPPTVTKGSELCGLCHSQLATRPADFPQVTSEHYVAAEGCTSCHNPHKPKLVAASPIATSTSTPTPGAPPSPTPTPTAAGPGVPTSIPHTLEGRANCLACHGPGGFKSFPLDHAGRTDQTCLVCHK